MALISFSLDAISEKAEKEVGNRKMIIEQLFNELTAIEKKALEFANSRKHLTVVTEKLFQNINNA